MSHYFTLPDETRLLLRHPTEQDIPQLLDAVMCSKAELIPWMDWCHEQFNATDVETWVRSTTAAEDEHSFVIVDDKAGMCFGTCGLNEISQKRQAANLGYWTRTDAVGRGIAPAATCKVAEVAFTELELARVEIVADVNNLPSQRVAEKVGATREGTIRNGLIHREEPRDAVLFSLIPADLNLV